MSDSDLLHQYFDEGLESAHEDVLFDRLAANSELRHEFTEHMKLHSIVNSDIMNITTPAAATRDLFASLGLRVPSGRALDSSTNAHGFSGGFLRSLIWFQKAIPLIVTAIVSAALTTGVFLLSDHRDQTPASSPHSEILAHSATHTFFAHDMTDTKTNARGTGHAVMQLQPAEPILSIASPQVEVGTSSVATAITAMLASEAFAPDTNDTIPAERATSIGNVDAAGVPFLWEPSTLHEGRTQSERMQQLFSMAPIPEGPKPHFFSPSKSFLENLVFEMRLLNSRSYPQVDLPYNEHAWFKDIAFSAEYKVSDYHALGIEYGRETFGQEFSSQENIATEETRFTVVQTSTPVYSGLPGSYRQNKLLGWYGIVWKLSFPEFGFMNMVFPYARTFVGATGDGPLGKMRLGFEFYPTSFSMMNIGVEGSILRYKVDKVWYQTNKLGVTFGVAIGF